ncbi:E3 ubiquitin-protein ligase TRAF7-like isoform X2 [Dreissena polymorpha]|uniref:E3 ubiquitin-protein ligase TRAF7-like isoform X2 n=1 Tax=Dreissena polymorpha TaxID=45954 RepID=UPI0022652099|nr:E3 ubiquitin-protein ligase TRAF7-like isoform X2 [Dreissena polymorpha]
MAAGQTVRESFSVTEDSPVVFVTEPSPHFLCPVCRKLYQEPVIINGCGHTICKQCASTIEKCPIDHKVFVREQMIVNRFVVDHIEDLLIYCKHGLLKQGDTHVQDPSGCQEKIHLGTRVQHEENCQFKIVHCSNPSCEAKCRKCEMVEHKKVCVYNKCSHGNKGCEFQGREEDTQLHETTCGYRALQPIGVSSALEQKTVQLETSNRELVKQVSSLNMRLGQLEEVNTSLQGQLTECNKALKELNQKYETVVSSIEQVVTMRNRRSYGSPGGQGEGRPRSTSSSIRQTYQSSIRHSLSGSPPGSRMDKWNMPFQFKCIGTLRGHQDVVWCMASKDRKLYSAGKDRSVKIWDLDNLQRGCIKTIQGHADTVQCMCIGGDNLYTGGHDNTIYCWSLEDYSLVKSVTGAHDNVICTMAIAGAYLFTASFSLQEAHDNIICTMAIAGVYLFTASFSLIKIWEAKTMTWKHTIPGLHHWVRALALNPDKDKLFSGSHNTIDIWSVTEPFSLRGKVDHQFGSIYSLAVTSKYIIAGTYNRNIHVYSVKTYEYINALKGHIGVINSLCVSPCEGFCFSASSDSSIKIWNLENMLPIQTLQRHEGSVNTLVVHRDFLFSGSEDKEIKVFMYFQMQMGFAVNT